MAQIRKLLQSLSFKGELFASTFAYALTAAIKLASSLVLTRLLNPESYGIFGILLSLLFIVELLSDVGTTALLIRHPRGSDRRFVHTVWTVRFIRSFVNFSLVFFAAPLIARLYNTPILTSAFRLLSVWFLISGTESMSFALAQRDRKARISNYTDLITSALMTVFLIYAARILHNHYALIFGALLQRALLSVASHFFYRGVGVGIAFDREALSEQFRFARFVIPSSCLTILLSQYDKLILLKFFDLSIVGIYTVAGNMLAPITGLISHNARVVLYARCADYFRTNRETACARYYSENHKLLLVGVLIPAVLAGAAYPAVSILYDARYAMAGHVLMIIALGAVLLAFQQASENLLVAYGKTHMVLTANVIRVIFVVPASILGFYLFGLFGFLWFTFAATVPLLLYFFYQQHRLNLFRLKPELQLLGASLIAFALSFVAAHLFLKLLPDSWLHLGSHKL
jgi:lipopolysaccharide exporter